MVKDDPLQGMLQEKGGRGFPYLIFMDGKGEVLSEVGYPRTIENFEKAKQEANQFLALRKKAASGDKKAQVEYFMVRLKKGRISLQAAKADLKGLEGLTDAQKSYVKTRLVDLEITEMGKGVRSQKDAIAVGAKYYELAKNGKKPTDAMVAGNFYIFICLNGVKNKKKDMVKLGVKGLKAIENRRAQMAANYFEQQMKKLGDDEEDGDEEEVEEEEHGDKKGHDDDDDDDDDDDKRKKR